MLLQTKNVTKVYQLGDIKVRALRGVSLGVERGDFVAIMGPSGSGKSTLMHIMGALDTPTTGSYFLDGEDVSKLSDDQLSEIRNQKIGFVFQAFNLLPRVTALKNVMLPLVYAGVEKKERRERAKEALEAVGLSDRLENLSNQLSGGEIQRVAIARALVGNPLVIFGDEPTGNLDTKSWKEIMKIFQDLNDAGHTIIIVTHEPYLTKYAKRVIYLKDGEVVRNN